MIYLRMFNIIKVKPISGEAHVICYQVKTLTYLSEVYPVHDFLGEFQYIAKTIHIYLYRRENAG